MGYIYLIRNLVNGKGYIGQTVNKVARRFDQHKYSANRGSNDALHRAMRKYGIENFSVKEVVSCESLLLNDLERHYIQFYGTFASIGHGYNMTEGGDGTPGTIPTAEQRKNMSSAHKGKKLSTMHKTMISKALKGKQHTPAHIANAALALKGRKHSVDQIKKHADKIRGRKLGPRSDEVKAKISAAKMGHKMPDHVKAILIEANKGKHCSEETRMKMSLSHKRRSNVN